MVASMTVASVPGIIDVEFMRGPTAMGSEVDLVIEIPHGATRTEDYDRLAARLSSPLPDGLVDFFHVNTDAGAPELGLAIAKKFIAANPSRAAAVLRCRVPRTFIDCNRQIDASPEDFKAGKVSPGLMPWITDPEDRAMLRAAHESYVSAVRTEAAKLNATGAMLLLHTYAPRTVDVEVDLDIVKSLRAAYQPEVEPTWPLRPEVDVIGKGTDGKDYAPAAVVEALRAELAPLTVADGSTYPLHPSTQAWDHVMARPGRALCIEVRRDLLADPFEPFVQMRIAPTKVDRLAGPIAAAMRRFW
jgi:predicted N-formylglutamate amidohydrolase